MSDGNVRLQRTLPSRIRCTILAGMALRDHSQSASAYSGASQDERNETPMLASNSSDCPQPAPYGIDSPRSRDAPGCLPGHGGPSEPSRHAGCTHQADTSPAASSGPARQVRWLDRLLPLALSSGSPVLMSVLPEACVGLDPESFGGLVSAFDFSYLAQFWDSAKECLTPLGDTLRIVSIARRELRLGSRVHSRPRTRPLDSVQPATAASRDASTPPAGPEVLSSTDQEPHQNPRRARSAIQPDRPVPTDRQRHARAHRNGPAPERRNTPAVKSRQTLFDRLNREAPTAGGREPELHPPHHQELLAPAQLRPRTQEADQPSGLRPAQRKESADGDGAGSPLPDHRPGPCSLGAVDHRLPAGADAPSTTPDSAAAETEVGVCPPALFEVDPGLTLE